METEARSRTLVDKLEKFVEIYEKHVSPAEQKEINEYYTDGTGIPRIVELSKEVITRANAQTATKSLLKVNQKKNWDLEDTLSSVHESFDGAMGLIKLHAIDPESYEMTRIKEGIAALNDLPDDIKKSAGEALAFLEQQRESGAAFYSLSKAMPELKAAGLTPKFVRENMPEGMSAEITFGSFDSTF